MPYRLDQTWNCRIFSNSQRFRSESPRNHKGLTAHAQIYFSANSRRNRWSIRLVEISLYRSHNILFCAFLLNVLIWPNTTWVNSPKMVNVIDWEWISLINWTGNKLIINLPSSHFLMHLGVGSIPLHGPYFPLTWWSQWGIVYGWHPCFVPYCPPVTIPWLAKNSQAASGNPPLQPIPHPSQHDNRSSADMWGPVAIVSPPDAIQIRSDIASTAPNACKQHNAYINKKNV